MMASLRTAWISSGVISGVGLARAKITGSGFIRATISPVTIPPADSPTKTSAPVRASVRVRSGRSVAKRSL